MIWLPNMICSISTNRITAADALKHEYFRDFQGQSYDLNCPPFDDNFERDQNVSLIELRAMVIEEQQALL